MGKGPPDWVLTEAKLREYAEAFPAVDALAECRRALQWVRDNPRNRKTASGMPAFLNRWFSRSQNASRPAHASNGAAGRTQEGMAEKIARIRRQKEDSS